VWVATTPGYETDAEAVSWCCERNQSTHASCTVTNDPEMACFGADVVYTDVWASMGQESEATQRQEVFRPYQVNAKLFGVAKPEAIFLHCLPAHRGDE